MRHRDLKWTRVTGRGGAAVHSSPFSVVSVAVFVFCICWFLVLVINCEWQCILLCSDCVVFPHYGSVVRAGAVNCVNVVNPWILDCAKARRNHVGQEHPWRQGQSYAHLTENTFWIRPTNSFETILKWPCHLFKTSLQKPLK